MRRGLTHLLNLIGTPRSMLALENKPVFPAYTRDEDLGPCTSWRGIERGPWQLAWRLDFSEATRADP